MATHEGGTGPQPVAQAPSSNGLAVNGRAPTSGTAVRPATGFGCSAHLATLDTREGRCQRGGHAGRLVPGGGCGWPVSGTARPRNDPFGSPPPRNAWSCRHHASGVRGGDPSRRHDHAKRRVCMISRRPRRGRGAPNGPVWSRTGACTSGTPPRAGPVAIYGRRRHPCCSSLSGEPSRRPRAGGQTFRRPAETCGGAFRSE